MDRLKVLTLNIWNRQGPWEARRAVIREGIEALAPDVVGLQEVLRLEGAGQAPSQAEELAEGFGYHVAHAPAWEIGGGLTFGNAILARWPIVERQQWALPVEPGNETRCLQYALVDAPCGKVPVFNTHLSWKLHHAHVRAEQVKLINARILELAPVSGFPPILMGDMNAEPDSDEMRYLRGLTALGGRGTYFSDCWHVRGEGPGYTFARENSYTAPAHEPSRRIDYVYTRGPDRQYRGEPLAVRVVLDRPRDGVFASDHYGVYAEIAAAPRAA
jgi:endonuclease/exonuclease/phosphatase family metal-dependent hydrolase